MKVFPTEKSRIILFCTGLVMLLVMIIYLVHNDRYKAASLFYACQNKTIVALSILSPIEFRVDFFGMIYEGRSGNALDNNILCFGAQEKYILYFLRDVAESLGNDEVVFYDIGANVGQHSLFMSKHVKEVHAFEPYPPVLERFRKLVAINRIDNIYIHSVGLGDKNGQLPFFEPPEFNLGAGSFIKGENRKDGNSTMPIVVGDEWLKENGTSNVDIIKCDIEGYEKKALGGLKHTLGKNRPIIVMELNTGLEDSFQSIDDFYSTFPPDYEFLFFCAVDSYTGHYELCKYDEVNFREKNIYNIIVYPKEKRGLIKMENNK